MYTITNIESFISKKKDPKGVQYFQLRCVSMTDGFPNLKYQFAILLNKENFEKYGFQIGDEVIPLISPASGQGDYRVLSICKI